MNEHTCGKLLTYSKKYDTFYCRSCNEWLEAKCSDDKCMYCKTRPETPLNEEIYLDLKSRNEI